MKPDLDPSDPDDEVATIDTETGERTPLPVPLTRISSAGWSPDGRRLSLLGSEGGGPTGLSVMDRAGGDARFGAAHATAGWLEP